MNLTAQGDEQSFKELYDFYYNKVYNLGMFLTHTELIAEEIVQEVFLKVWEKRDQLITVHNFNAWLRTITRNSCIDHLRRLSVEKLGLNEWQTRVNDNDRVTENDVLAREYEQLLQKAISKLSPQQKKVYLMSRQQGLKQEDIARELGISVYTVKEYMKIALKSIRASLDEHLELMVITAITVYF